MIGHEIVKEDFLSKVEPILLKNHYKSEDVLEILQWAEKFDSFHFPLRHKE
jgi:hypothetical protein